MENSCNNKVDISGILVSDFEYSHNVKEREMYKAFVETKRMSGAKDVIPFLTKDIPEKKQIGKRIKISGKYSSYNSYDENKKSHLILYVSPKGIDFDKDTEKDNNYIFLNGFICKEPVYRKTPLGREITDLLLAVNRSYGKGKSDYIPCICWGHNARLAGKLKVGCHIQVWGRIQSREYRKKIEEDYTSRTAYEVSIGKIEVVENE